MSQIVNMLDAKTSLSRLVHDLETGGAQEFIIARNGRPAARLVPLHAGGTDRARRIGVAKGRFKVPDDIDRSAAELARLFEAG
jgi:antitoxin (DNA-binding transcriptional repressor) of toxin-antitoxin stability system